MLKKCVTCVCVALAALLVTALPAGAGSLGGYTNAKIPFDFVVSGMTMPAGDYSIEILPGQPLVAVRGTNGRKAMGFTSRRVGNSISETKPQLIFRKQGNQLVRREVWMNTPPANSDAK